jgi:hypothetical protein
MRVAIYEDNLLWGPRLLKTVTAFGHEGELALAPEPMDADVAIVNLSSPSFPVSELVPKLLQAGLKVVAHAGHKERELHELGRDLGCHVLATNSEITNKLPQILEKLATI